MDGSIERAYKRTCFQGRGTIARWLDRVFFALLGGVCLHIVSRNLVLSGLLALGLLVFLILWDRKRWNKYRRQLYQSAATALKREAWVSAASARIQQEGGEILFPTPDRETLMGHCLRLGPGSTLHCFGVPKEDLIAQATAFGCTLVFHPWEEGPAPTRDQVLERLRRDAPMRDTRLWRQLLHLPGNRYLLTGCGLLILSMLLRRALYWRLLGSLCLAIGAFRRSFRLVTET